MTEQRALLLRACICQVTSEFQDTAIQKAGVLLSPQAGTCLEMSTTVGPQHCEALAHRLGQSTDLGQVYPVSLVLSCLVPSSWAHVKATRAFSGGAGQPPGAQSRQWLLLLLLLSQGC